MFRRIGERRRERERIEAEKMARLEQGERALGDLQHRAYHVIRELDNRVQRNHWRESIEQMIQGA